MKRKVALWTTSCAVSSLVLGAIAISCSVGEATTLPGCDPNAPPGAQGYCCDPAAGPNDVGYCYYPLAPCDDGTGYPKQDAVCCSEYAAAIYQQLCGAQGVPIDDPAACFLSVCPYPGAGTDPACPAAVPGDGCCGTIATERSALNGYELCITGRLGDRDAGSAGGAGGSGATGGSAGSGGI